MRAPLHERIHARREFVRLVTGRRPPIRRRMPRQREPNAIRLSYLQDIRAKVLAPAVELVRSVLMPQLRPLLEQAAFERGDSTRADADGGKRIRRVVSEMRARAEMATPERAVEEIAARAARRTEAFQREQLGAQLKAGLGVDPLESHPHLTARIEHFVAENVALIKTVPDRYFADIEREVLSAVRTGRRWEELADDLVERAGVAESRATLIARDQVGKFYGDLQEAQQTDLGIDSYVWRGMLDNRERPEHVAREGKTFAWASPPADGHPGEAIQCRCYAEPVLAGVLEGLGGPKLVPAPEPEPPAPPPVPLPPPPPPPPAVPQPEGLALREQLRPAWEANGANHADDPFDPTENFTAAWVERVRTAPVTINLRADRLEQVLKTGEFKNLFQTGTSGGSNDKAMRRQAEQDALGIPATTKGEIRPIYGALHTLHDHPTKGAKGAAPRYGESWVALKPGIKARSSFTPDDTFGLGDWTTFTADHPKPLAYEARSSGQAAITQGKDPASIYSYIEAQIWGGVTPADIAEVHVPEYAYRGTVRDTLQEAKEKYGLRIIVHHTGGGTTEF